MACTHRSRHFNHSSLLSAITALWSLAVAACKNKEKGQKAAANIWCLHEQQQDVQ